MKKLYRVNIEGKSYHFEMTPYKAGLMARKFDVVETTRTERALRCIARPFAALIAFFDWLGQQDETLKQCYTKRLNLWGVL